MGGLMKVVPYDPDWPRRFRQERAVLDAVFSGSDVTIEHIGSTAVPGLGAKPVIDVLVGLTKLTEVENRVTALEAKGYEYVPQYEIQLPERRYFRKPRFRPRAFHLHCVLKGSDLWLRHIAFRDYLRTHAEAAVAYYALKRELAGRCSKEAYAEAKSPFIEEILASALGRDDH